MFRVLACLLILYLIANTLVLTGLSLIDFGFCLVLFGIFALLAILNWRLRLGYYSIGLAFAAWFFLSMSWVSAFSLWQLDHRLDESLEGKVLVVAGLVGNLPDQQERRQVFEFLAEAYWQCPIWHLSEVQAAPKNLSDCERLSLSKKPLESRRFALELTERLWFYFFRHKLDNTAGMPKKIRVALYQYSKHAGLKVKAGERYQLLLKLKRPRSSLNFHGFDYETWLFTQGIHANAYVKSIEGREALTSFSFGIRNSLLGNISRIRENLRQELIVLSQKSNALDESEQKEVSQAMALILALTIGDRSFISIENKKLLVNTGTAHLLAISGMHIALLSALSFFIIFNLSRIVKWFFASLGRVQGESSNLRVIFFSLISNYIAPIKLAAISSLLLAGVYALLAGFSLPTQRALIMVFAYSFVLIFYQRVNFYNLWCLTLLLVLIHDPFAVLSSGLYLSFIAVFIIQWVLLGYFYKNSLSVYQRIKSTFRVQVAVCLALMPLTAWFFSGFFPLALLSNVLAIPFVSLVILPLSLLMMFLLLHISFPMVDLKAEQALSDILLIHLDRFSERCIDLLLIFLSQVQNISPKTMFVSLELLPALSLFFLIVLLLSPFHNRLKLLTSLFFLPLIFFFQSEGIPEGEMRFQLLDVGQGLAVIIETKNHRMVYDTGPAFGESFDAGSAIVAPALLSTMPNFSKRTIDYLLLSHGDSDHIGGAESMINIFNIENILGYHRDFYQKKENHFPELSEWMNCEAGQSWIWDKVSFEIIYPSADDDYKVSKSNNLSCVLYIRAKSFSLLLPGDIEKQAELDILKRYKELKADVVVVAHHGSNTSSKIDFIQQLSPSLALVSAGFKNQFGHPHQDVLKRFEDINSSVLMTAHTGALTLESWHFEKEAPLSGIQQARMKRHRFWRF